MWEYLVAVGPYCPLVFACATPAPYGNCYWTAGVAESLDSSEL